MKNIQKDRGITLVALVITIIILLILAGITISQLTGSGLFENAKLAKEKSDAAQEKEDTTMSDYENKIGEYVDGTRENNNTNTTTSTKIKSLINKDDGVYNKTEGGYVFSTPTSTKTISSNNVINLTDSIENYDYIIFEVDVYRTVSSPYMYTYPNTIMLSTSRIKESYTDKADDVSKMHCITDNLGDVYSRVRITFKDKSTFTVCDGVGSLSSISKLRITDIKGIKY